MYQVLSVSIDRNSSQLDSLVNAFIHVFNKHLLKTRHGARLQNYYSEQDSDSAIVVVQSLRCARHFATLQTAAHQASLSFTISQNLLKFPSIDSVMASNHVLFCCPFSSHPQSFPAPRSFLVSWLFTQGGRSIGASASASILPNNIQRWFSLGLTGLISLLSNGLSGVFSSTTIQKHQFFSTQPSLWSNSPIQT